MGDHASYSAEFVFLIGINDPVNLNARRTGLRAGYSLNDTYIYNYDHMGFIRSMEK